MATPTHAQIRMKSYFTTSIPDAIDMARKELGPDALLLNSRQSPPEARHLGPIEVIFGDDRDVYASNARHSDHKRPSFTETPGLDELRQKVDRVCDLLTGNAASAARAGSRRGVLEEVLLDEGMSRELASEIEDCINIRVNRARTQEPHAAIRELTLQAAREEMNDRFDVKPGIGNVTALVGPPGSGKTTTLVKLAISEGLMKNRRVRLVSADAQRIAASEQLRIYAAILGVPFQSAESMSALAQAVESTPANTLLLIDTPGLSPALFDGPGSDLAAFFRHRQDIDTHLVLTASTRANDLEKAGNRFAAFRPSAMIFTKTDETDSFGAAFSEAARTRMPVSYFSNGQLVPENILSATRDFLTESLVRRLPSVLTSAA